MSRIMAFDYGRKRTGIAVSDPLQIIATGLTTVITKDLYKYIKEYMLTEEVEAFVFGKSLHLNGEENTIQQYIDKTAEKLTKLYPTIKVYFEDERFTSKDAVQSMILGGVPKHKRRNKALIDEVSATLILQSFMETYKGK